MEIDGTQSSVSILLSGQCFFFHSGGPIYQFGLHDIFLGVQEDLTEVIVFLMIFIFINMQMR